MNLMIKLSSLLAPNVTINKAVNAFRTTTRSPQKQWEVDAQERSSRATTKAGLSYLRWTPNETKSRIIALHGWNGRATQFAPLAEELLLIGVETIALDGPGHGESPGHHADPLMFARALSEAEQELGPFRAVIGHSMGGGALAIAVAQGMPVERAVIISSPAHFSDVATKFAEWIGLPQRLIPRFLTAVGEATGVSIEDANIVQAAKLITIPGLMIHDRDDDEYDHHNAEQIANAWGGPSSILITQGLGHRRLLREQYVIDEITDFITD